MTACSAVMLRYEVRSAIAGSTAACAVATVIEASEASMPVTCAPSLASASLKRPPPHPTSKIVNPSSGRAACASRLAPCTFSFRMALTAVCTHDGVRMASCTHNPKHARCAPVAVAERVARELRADGVQRMQRGAAARRVPPLARQLLELGHLRRVHGGPRGPVLLRSPAPDSAQLSLASCMRQSRHRQMHSTGCCYDDWKHLPALRAQLPEPHTSYYAAW